MMCTLVSDRRLRTSVNQPQEIHSGHFMVSNLEDSESDVEEVDFSTDDCAKEYPAPTKVEADGATGKALVPFEELGSLFKYLEIACTGKLTSPKWNRFRGLRFPIKNTIRLNNIIWREYHMQFIKHLRPYAVYFQSPLTEKPVVTEFFRQTVLLEGKYWIRRMNSIRTEYCGWRMFGKSRVPSFLLRRKNIANMLGPPYPFPGLMDGFQDIFSPGVIDATFASFMNENLMDFDDNLDLIFEKPFNVPLSILETGDLVQPGLAQFAPDDVDEPMLGLPISSSGPLKSTSQSLLFNDSHFSFALSGGAATTGFNDSVERHCMTEPTHDDTTLLDKSHNSAGLSGPQHLIPNIGTQVCSNTEFFYQTFDPNFYDDDTYQHSIPLDRRERVVGSIRMHAKHGYQPVTQLGRRMSPWKRHRTIAPGRCRLNASYVTTPSDRSLRNKFRVNYFDSSGLDYYHTGLSSETPSLLNTLLQNKNIVRRSSVTAHKPAASSLNIHRSTCSAPLLFSALHTPSSSHVNSAHPPQHSFTSHLTVQQRPTTISEISANDANPLLITDSAVDMIEVQEKMKHTENQSSIHGSQVRFGCLPTDVEYRDASTNFQSDVFDQSKPRFRDGHVSAMTPPVIQSARPLNTHPYTQQLALTMPMNTEVPPFSQSQILPDDLPADPLIARLRSNSGNPRYERIAPAQSFEHGWSNHDMSSSSKRVEFDPSWRHSSGPLPTKQAQFFLPLSPVESTDAFSNQLPAADARTAIDENSTLRGRSSSAGNLFTLSQPLASRFSQSESLATVLNLGSSELLSSRLSNNQPLPHMSPSYSPPCIEGDQSSLLTAGHSSEERRRQSMQTSLQNLRHLIRTYGAICSGPGRHVGDATFINSEESSESLRTSLPKQALLTVSDETPGASKMGSQEPSSSSGSGRSSNAATLRQSAELIKGLRNISANLESKRQNLLKEIASLEATNSAHWEQLCPSGSMPSRGVSVDSLPPRASSWFAQYVHEQTDVSWKFYLFSLLIEQLFRSYYSTVNTASKEHLMRSIYTWVDQNCSAAQLRPALVRALCKLTTTTSALNDPSKLPEQTRRLAAERAAIQHNRMGPHPD